MRRSYILAATAALAVLLLGGSPSRAATAFTLVSHGDTGTEYHGEDICGDRANWVTTTLRTTVDHLTQRGDSYVFHFVETGTYHVDFVDPGLADQDSQFTGSNVVVLTPGQTFVLASTWHDFPTGLKIWESYHLTLVDGQAVIERYVLRVTGCP
jgi:hypothetical protein